MIVHTHSAKIVGDPAAALAWATEMTGIVNKLTGGGSQVATHLKGGSEIIWITNHKDEADLAAFEGKWRDNPEYKAAYDKGKHLIEPADATTQLLRVA